MNETEIEDTVASEFEDKELENYIDVVTEINNGEVMPGPKMMIDLVSVMYEVLDAQ